MKQNTCIFPPCACLSGNDCGISSQAISCLITADWSSQAHYVTFRFGKPRNEKYSQCKLHRLSWELCQTNSKLHTASLFRELKNFFLRWFIMFIDSYTRKWRTRLNSAVNKDKFLVPSICIHLVEIGFITGILILSMSQRRQTSAALCSVPRLLIFETRWESCGFP